MSIIQLNIISTLERLEEQEITQNHKKITIDDDGPKVFEFFDVNNNKHKIEGTYLLSNLLQELFVAKENQLNYINIDVVNEKPIERISNLIREKFWDGLTRKIDSNNILSMIKDDKTNSNILRIYLPSKDDIAFEYYTKLQEKFPNLEIIKLQQTIDFNYINSLNTKPGLLSLEVTKVDNKYFPTPYVVPGGRFNEMYGWDSYFESIGLIIDKRIDLAISMANNYKYQINNYGKILNANRTYYLGRTQPPFYTSLIREIYENTNDKNIIINHIDSILKEYFTVWMQSGSGKRLTNLGLNRYRAEGKGIPPETEKGHYDHEIKRYAQAENISIEEYYDKFIHKDIYNPTLFKYFIHDRTVRESGHDTSYRINGVCANLCTVDLNSFLYKYEDDISYFIKNILNDQYIFNGETLNSEYFENKKNNRKEAINKYLWNKDFGIYFDYNFKLYMRSSYISATSLFPLWAKLCDTEQAQKLIKNCLFKLIEKGGIASGTKESAGEINDDKPQRQWDYPFGWAPHQMLIWKGLINYNYHDLAHNLIYRWLLMITQNAVNYSITIPEKYDVVNATHNCFVEYGNVGVNFDYISQEGFGWMNASYQYGLSLLPKKYFDNLNNLDETDIVFGKDLNKFLDIK